MTDIEQAVDVVVIGLGPGGEELASRLADAGLTVLGVERELVGGECPYWESETFWGRRHTSMVDLRIGARQDQG